MLHTLKAIHSSAKLLSPPIPILAFCSCDKVITNRRYAFFLYLLGQIVSITLIQLIKLDYVLL